jgi:hypothetical protein
MDRRTELKQEYKNRPKNMGVYQIKNQVNGKIFIGSALNLDGMHNRFAMGIKYGNFSNGNTGLLEEMKAYGYQNFTIEVLDRLKQVEDPLYDYSEDLKTLEALWLEKLQPYEEKGYNKRK